MSDQAEAQIVRHQDPLMLPPGTSVMEAARQMHARRVRAVLVIEGNANLVGIFTERDAISRVLATGRDPVTTTLADVMTNNPETITPEHTAADVLLLMKELRVRHLPVVDAGKTVGIVVRNDFPELDRLAPPAQSP
jgi:CBS domain-containing protein